MPAQVENMAYFGKVPWHGLGVSLEEADLHNWERTCEKSGLNWDAELVPLQTADTHAKVVVVVLNSPQLPTLADPNRAATGRPLNRGWLPAEILDHEAGNRAFHSFA